jgi:hypothetical protein
MGSAARLKIAAQVALAAAFAVAAAMLFSWVAERPGLRARLDLTADRQNTLDPASRSALERLAEEAEIDTFFSSTGDYLAPTIADVQERTLRLLVLFRDSTGGRIRLREHDLSSAGGKAAARTRMEELALREIVPGGIVVVSRGARHAVLRVRGDLADVDPGDPLGRSGVPRPPRVLLFRGEEALVGALLQVAQAETVRALFSTGHGELDLEAGDLAGLTDLRTSLTGSGYDLGRWEGERAGRIPDDCAVLAIVGPEQPFTPAEVETIREFVESGGRVVAAPGAARSRARAVSRRCSCRTGSASYRTASSRRRARRSAGSRSTASPTARFVRVWSGGMAGASPVTEALRRADRYVDMPFARSLARGSTPVGGSVLTILTTGDEAWRDLEIPGTGHDWVKNPEEERGPFALGMTAVFPPSRAPRALAGPRAGRPDLAQPEARVVCLGSAAAFANQASDVDGDLVRAAFDWAASRDFRVHVTPRSAAARRIDVAQGSALRNVHFVAVILLPGLCLALGFLTWWGRRRR